MKKTIKYCVMAAVVSITLTGCTLWEDEWTECIPLPEVETPIDPSPWEPGGTDEKPVGD